MENKQSWAAVAGNLYKGVLIQTCCGIAASVFGIIAFLTFDLEDLLTGGWNIWNYLELFAGLGSLYGFFLFFTNLNPWKELVAEEDAKAIGSIYTATILQMVAVVLAFIPVIGLIGSILSIVAWVLLLLAYSKLKDSATFPAKAKEGANKIFIAMIVSIVSAVIAIIPVIGLIGLIGSIVALIFTLQGWKLIAEGE